MTEFISIKVNNSKGRKSKVSFSFFLTIVNYICRFYYSFNFCKNRLFFFQFPFILLFSHSKAYVKDFQVFFLIKKKKLINFFKICNRHRITLSACASAFPWDKKKNICFLILLRFHSMEISRFPPKEKCIHNFRHKQYNSV